ncbi:MAG: hypothetical protein A2538_04095 [Candidatus Magasanikbacteria bacterium RIFOXYD2_FULL_41_14]|uniref:Polymerase nucleotidyl transferase domain-containing protein n=1 Tax=Candidatus Magasanikbacteria bacterium RIFOXYD2_FULL_41_14 TaxID=1798709 RepID=A0A1F6PG04_9BACT|nr:MAG: hypothetical protein A2538_04095 [Candidatus Magasanikbacteria bacterium RIFOXYD2_FULL_41_14]
MSSPLENSIVKTLTYFDGFDLPLTQTELFARLWQPPFVSFLEFTKFFENHTSNYWQSQDGFYFLAGRSELIVSRNRHLLDSAASLKIARRAVKKIRSVPFLRAVFVCNSVGAGTARPDSDIDFLVVAEVGRVWIVRLFTNLILLFWRLRTHGHRDSQKICLSFFVDKHNLDMANWRVVDDDIHFAYWLHQMVPLYDEDNIYDKLITANRWADKFLPNIKQSYNYISGVVNSRVGKIWKIIWEKFWTGAYGDLIEGQARQLQMVKLKSRLRDKINARDKGVVLGAGVIKLHEQDTRALWYSRWKEKTAKI